MNPTCVICQEDLTLESYITYHVAITVGHADYDYCFDCDKKEKQKMKLGAEK